MQIPPKRITGGIRYLAKAFNDLLAYVQRTKVIPVAGWQETPDGLLPPSLKPSYTPPWQVKANGDNTVSVGAGAILSYPDEDDLTLSRYKDFAGTDSVTVTDDGFIYGSINAALGLSYMASPTGTFTTDEFTDSNGDTGTANVDVTLYLHRVFPDVNSEITVGFATTLPLSNSVFHFEIAQVTFADDVATVSRQTLHHNPTLWSFIEPP